MNDDIENIAISLYNEIPNTILYHYTSLNAFQSILNDCGLWATEIHYLNDSSEIKWAVKRFLSELETLKRESTEDLLVITQLEEWLNERISNGNMLFITSFSENGNLLSQWRAYSQIGKGLSLGFSPSYLIKCANNQKYQIGRCVYNLSEQQRIAKNAMTSLVKYATIQGPAPSNVKHPSQSYHVSFEKSEAALLRIAALLKNPAFYEETEWRILSPVISNYVNTEMFFRTSLTTLIPYVNFNLRFSKTMGIDHICLGPTSDNNLSMQALSMFCSRNGIYPKITSCQMPYRSI